MLHRTSFVSFVIAMLLGPVALDAAPPWKQAYRAHRGIVRAQLEVQQQHCNYPPVVYQAQKRQLRQYERQLWHAYRAAGQPALLPQLPATPVRPWVGIRPPVVPVVVSAVPVRPVAPQGSVPGPVPPAAPTTVRPAQHLAPAVVTESATSVAAEPALEPIPRAAPVQPATGNLELEPTPAKRPEDGA